MRPGTVQSPASPCSCSGRPSTEASGGFFRRFVHQQTPQRCLGSSTLLRQTARGGRLHACRSSRAARCASATAVVDQLDPSTAAAAAAVDHPTAAPAALPPSVARLLWDAVDRPLLRVGKVGVTASHLTSLRELLEAHTLVKVQLNAVHMDVELVGDELAAGTGATLLPGKGRTLLLGAPHRDVDQLLQVADAKQRRGAEQKAAALERLESPTRLSSVVEAKLRSLVSGHVISATDFDSHSIRALAALPEQKALDVLQGCTKVRLRGVRNRSAWLTSKCRRVGDKTPTPEK